MKFLGSAGGELRAERAHSALGTDEGGGESMRKGSSRPAVVAADTRHERVVNGDEPMSANDGDHEEIPFADDDDDEENGKGEAQNGDPGGPEAVAQGDGAQTEEETGGVRDETSSDEVTDDAAQATSDTEGQVSFACEESDKHSGGERRDLEEDEEASSTPTSSSEEDSQRRPTPGGAETEREDEEEEQVVARSIVRCRELCRIRRRRVARKHEAPLGILKGTSGRVTRRRVTFNEMMTVFMDGCPEVQVPAFRPWDLTFSEVCYMYEPPPEYRDWEAAFEPPDGYRDLDGVTTFDDANCSGSSDDDRGPVPPAELRDSETLFPMEDEDLSSGEFVVHRVTIVEPEPEMVQLNDSSDQEDELVDEPTAFSAEANSDVTDDEESQVRPQIGYETEDDECAKIEEAEVPLVVEEELILEPVLVEVIEEPEVQVMPEVVTDESTFETPSGSETEGPVESHVEADDEADKTDEVEDPSKVSRTNSQIRRSLELSALRRSLLRGEMELVAARRRRQVVNRPKSPSSSGIEEKLRWLTSTEDLSTSSMPMSPPRGGPTATNGPTRWTSEVLYPPPSSTFQPTISQPPPPQQQQQQQQQLPYYRPPSRPSSFDPHIGLIAWEGFLQQRDRTRATYQRHVERHPNAPERPNDAPPPPRRPSNNSDELEWFVERDSERTERIKKRYSLSEEEDPTFGFGRRPSVRGIRPRFGSTTEILQQLQSQLQKRPPPPPNCLLYSSLPRNVGSTGPLLPYPDLVARLPKVNEETGKRRAGEPVAIIRPAGKGHPSPEPSINSNQKGFVCKDERGAPEGASSSPKMSTDSLYAAGSGHGKAGFNSQQPPKEDVVVYYSLRV